MVKKLLFLMALVLTTALPLWADEATVYDGTATNSYVPIHGNYCDDFQRQQVIYNANDLAEAGITPGSTINSLTFYSSSSSKSWTSTFEVYMTETASTTFSSSYLEVTGLTPVIPNTTFEIKENLLTMTFVTPYVYGGGNLLLDIQSLTDGNWSSASFYGQSGVYGSIRGYHASGVSSITNQTAQNFVPKTTFHFIPGAVSCERPSVVNATNITDSSADITWAGSASSYELVVNNEASIETSTSKTLTGLNPSTLYTIKVRAICAEGDTSTYRSTSFKTLCGVITADVWEESFESHTTGTSSSPAPDCWAIIGANNGSYPYIYVHTNSTYVSAGSKSLYQVSSNSAECFAILPEVKNPHQRQLTFKYKTEASDGKSSPITVGYVTDVTDASTFHALSPVFGNTTTWTEVEVALNGIPAEDANIARIAIRYGMGSANNYYSGIDELRLEKLPTCFRPTDAAIENIDFTSADLVWTAANGETEFNVVVTNGEETLYNGAVSGTSLSLTGLESSTTYTLNVSITAVCGPDDQSKPFETSMTFRTNCEIITADVWNDNFENYQVGNNKSVAPGCWEMLNANGTTYPYMFVNNSPTYVSEGSKSLYNQSSKSKASYAILPEIANLRAKQLSFRYRSENATASPTLTIGYMTDITDEESFVALSENLPQSYGKFTDVEFILDGIPAADADIARLAIRFNASTTDNYYTGIDEVYVEPIPTCFKSEGGIEITEIGSDTLAIKWLPSAVKNERSYNIVVKTAVDTLFNGNVADTCLVLRNLTPATTYNLTVAVTSVCGPDDNSKTISSNLTVTTLCVASVAPWIETFNTAVNLPVCWDKSEGTAGVGSWILESNSSKLLDGKYIKFDSYITQTNKWQKLVTPVTLLPANDESTLSFAWKNPTGGAMSILLTADGGMSYDTLRTDMVDQTTWALDTISLDAYRGQEVSVVFLPISNYGSDDAYVYLDNIAFNAPMYDIVFVVNGDTVQAESVKYLTEIAYNGAAPTRAATAQYTYTFKGWSEMIAPATGHTTYVAEFDSVVNQYEVVFKKWSGQVLQREKLDYGTMPAFHGAEPFCEPTLAKVYTFVGWTPEIVEVTENAVYTAVLDSVDRKFKIDFVNEDGTLLKSDSVVYANKPAYTGATPTKASDAQFHYVFSGWDPVIISVYGDATYTAQFAPVARKYAVTWKNADGSTLRVDSVAYGKVPAYKGTPAKAGTAQYSYVFSGWTPAVDTVKADAAYTAQYNQVVNQYLVKVYAASGTVSIDGEGNDFIVSKSVDYGTEVTILATPLEGYKFEKWVDGNTENPRKVVITDNAIFTAWFGIVPTQTGLDNIESEDGIVKFIMNGKVYIKIGDRIFDATGKLVK